MLLTIHANKSKRGITRVSNNFYRVVFGTVTDTVKHLPFTVDTNCCEKRGPFPVRFNSDFWRNVTASSFSNISTTRLKTAFLRNVNLFASSVSDHTLLQQYQNWKIVFEIGQRISGWRTEVLEEEGQRHQSLLEGNITIDPALKLRNLSLWKERSQKQKGR